MEFWFCEPFFSFPMELSVISMSYKLWHTENDINLILFFALLLVGGKVGRGRSVDLLFSACLGLTLMSSRFVSRHSPRSPFYHQPNDDVEELKNVRLAMALAYNNSYARVFHHFVFSPFSLG